MEPKNSDLGKVKRKIVRATIELKKEIISKHERGVRVTDLALQFGFPKSTICTILKNKDAIKRSNVAKGVKVLTKQRSQIIDEVEKLLLVWINEEQLAGDCVPEALICEKARLLHDELLKKNPGTSADVFKASRGWFQNFKRRSGILTPSAQLHIDKDHESVSPSPSNLKAEEPTIESQSHATTSHAPSTQSSHIDEQAIKTWTKGEITMWLTKYNLEDSSLVYLTGEEIIFLHKLKYEAPEFFYHCLETKLHLESLLDLSRATDALADLTW